MKVLITGWYGTETIGDRAILASLLKDLFEAFGEGLDVLITSIYPFFTMNTLSEDKELYRDIMRIPERVVDSISLVDARKPAEVRRSVLESNLVIMGGGPFDQIAQMSLIEYAFSLAKKKSKSTLVYGCGINVLKSKRYVKSLSRILHFADSIILRDGKSAELAIKYSSDSSIREKISVAIDPAVFTAVRFIESGRYSNCVEDEKYIALNLRDYPEIYDTERSGVDVNNNAVQTLNLLNIDTNVRFVPMHYFDTGGDDRIIGCRAKGGLNFELKVPAKPLNLMQTMEQFSHAAACIGMRFHSVVLQTIVNGNNYILNYTDSNYGKIPAFVEEIGGQEFYKTRIVNLQSGEHGEMMLSEKAFSYNDENIQQKHAIFQRALAKML